MEFKLKNKSGKIFNLCFFLFLAVFLTPSLGGLKAASIIADTPCDNLYYETLSSRAWLEAQREITQNQNLILKPDSVFEYTCFDLLLSELADHASSLLSETTSFGSGLGTNSMDQALQLLIGNSLIAYINNNYGSKDTLGLSYNLLGGHPAAVGIAHAPRTIRGSNSYSCDIMARVWQAAKCINFASNEDTDGFYSFENYALSLDKRILPSLCLPATTAWNTNLATALTSGPWTNDPVQTYFSMTNAQNCSGGTCACTGDPIPTGLMVTRSGYPGANSYAEHVCLQPGCRYHPGGALNSGGSTASAGCYGR